MCSIFANELSLLGCGISWESTTIGVFRGAMLMYVKYMSFWWGIPFTLPDILSVAILKQGYSPIFQPFAPTCQSCRLCTRFLYTPGRFPMTDECAESHGPRREFSAPPALVELPVDVFLHMIGVCEGLSGVDIISLSYCNKSMLGLQTAVFWKWVCGLLGCGKVSRFCWNWQCVLPNGPYSSFSIL